MTEDYPKPSSYYRERMVERLLKLTSSADCVRIDTKWRSNKKGEHFPIENGKVSKRWLHKRDYARFCETIAGNIRNKTCQMVGKLVATPLHEMYEGDTAKLVFSTKSIYNPSIKYVIEFGSSDEMYDALEAIKNGT